jgi:hypothetical protein
MSSETHHSFESVHTYEIAATESVSDAVIRAVSAATGHAPSPDPENPGACLDPLYTAIDPDALNSIFDPTGTSGPTSDGEVTFRYHGYTVTVESAGRVILEPQQ